MAAAWVKPPHPRARHQTPNTMFQSNTHRHTLQNLVGTALPADDPLIEKHRILLNSDLNWVTFKTTSGREWSFWVFNKKFVTTTLTQLSTIEVYPNFRRFVREFNLKYHPDKYRGVPSDAITSLYTKINWDPCVDSINDLLDILAMPIKRRPCNAQDPNMYSIKLCDNLSDMLCFCQKRTVGLSFFHLPLINRLITEEFDRHVNTVLTMCDAPTKTICRDLFKNFKPSLCPRFKWLARAAKDPLVGTSVTCINRLIHAIHRITPISDDWVQFVNVALRESMDKSDAGTVLVALGTTGEAPPLTPPTTPPVTPQSPAPARLINQPSYKTKRPADIDTAYPTPKFDGDTAYPKRKKIPTPHTPVQKRVTRSMAAPRRSKRLRR